MAMDMIERESLQKKVFIGSCCGNNFVIVDSFVDELNQQSKKEFAKKNIVKYGVDSALFLSKSNGLDLFMEVFERDGSESDSCGNGVIVAANLLGLNNGIVEMKGNVALISNGSEKLGMSMNVKLSSTRRLGEKCMFVKIGEPHIIYLVDDIYKFDLLKVGGKAQEKYYDGVNVDVIQRINDNCYLIKTYERGVFRETKSCGTGSLSSYIAISHFNKGLSSATIEFRSVGGSHWISRDKNMLKLEVLKESCKFKEIMRLNVDETDFNILIPNYLNQFIVSPFKRVLLKARSVLIKN
jgi:diaminopimelate epimerase